VICKRYILNTFTNSSVLSKFLKLEDKFSFKPVTKYDVFKQLKSIDKLSASGHSGIESSIIKYGARELAQPFTELFNLFNLRAVLSGFSLIIGANVISFTKIVRLLGVMIDDKLKFDCHVSTLCKKVASKVHLLKKSSFMFDMKFKVILYKMFIQSSFEFCSTLFFDLKISSELDRLDKCFCRSINKYLSYGKKEKQVMLVIIRALP